MSGAGVRSYSALLAAILAAFALQGIAEPGRWELAFITALLGFTLLLSLRIAAVRPAVLRATEIIVLALIVFSFGEALANDVSEQVARLANALLVIFAPPAILVGVIRKLRDTRAVTVEAVIGVLCVYVLLGMFFSFLYGVVDRFGHTPFFAGGQEATVARCLYYSFTTLATVGYGDLTAATNLGHTLSVSEALFGQVYLVTVVSLIVGNLGRQRRRDA
ncbi:MAG: potassium channel family protein [Solirubrobacteraceae bacterium]